MQLQLLFLLHLLSLITMAMANAQNVTLDANNISTQNWHNYNDYRNWRQPRHMVETGKMIQHPLPFMVQYARVASLSIDFINTNDQNWVSLSWKRFQLKIKIKYIAVFAYHMVVRRSQLIMTRNPMILSIRTLWTSYWLQQQPASSCQKLGEWL